MTQEEFKWANQLHWQVKGHLIPDSWCNDHKQVTSMMNGYFKRLWGNHEANIHLEGFDQAWEQRYGQQQNQ
jgi:hypothetical protein